MYNDLASHQPRLVPASMVRNYILGDPILDWLELFGEEAGYRRDYQYPELYIAETDFAEFVIRKGVEFEEAVLVQLNKRLTAIGEQPFCVPVQNEEASSLQDATARTIKLINEGASVIYHGTLYSPSIGCYGIPDLLVRADLLDVLTCEYDAVNGNRYVKGDAPENTRYEVIDVKFTTIELNHLYEVANSGSLPAYKAQVSLYCAMLGEMLEHKPEKGYLIGRGWKKGSDRSDSSIDRLCSFAIDQPQFRGPNTNWFSRAIDGVEWIRRLRNEGASWHVVPFSPVAELRPNMKSVEDYPWHNAKREIAKENGDLTLLWQVGTKIRNEMASKTDPITNWHDVRLSSAEMGLGSSTGSRLQSILDINRSQDNSVVRPQHIVSERNTWAIKNGIEFYVDFETFSDLNDDFAAMPLRHGQPLIFMIGCGHYENGSWQFRVFTAKEISEASELSIIDGWMNHMQLVKTRLGSGPEEPIVFHWSQAETSTLTEAYNSACMRHGIKPRVNWFDFLSKVIKPAGTDSCVTFKGALGFGLKAIGKALYGHGLIDTCWDDGPTDGLGAMVGAWWCYSAAKEQGIRIQDVLTPLRQGESQRYLMREIERYNEVDCKVMAEIINYLRDNH